MPSAKPCEPEMSEWQSRSCRFCMHISEKENQGVCLTSSCLADMNIHAVPTICSWCLVTPCRHHRAKLAGILNSPPKKCMPKIKLPSQKVSVSPTHWLQVQKAVQQRYAQVEGVLVEPKFLSDLNEPSAQSGSHSGCDLRYACMFHGTARDGGPSVRACLLCSHVRDSHVLVAAKGRHSQISPEETDYGRPKRTSCSMHERCLELWFQDSEGFPCGGARVEPCTAKTSAKANDGSAERRSEKSSEPLLGRGRGVTRMADSPTPLNQKPGRSRQDPPPPVSLILLYVPYCTRCGRLWHPLA